MTAIYKEGCYPVTRAALFFAAEGRVKSMG